MDDRVETLEVLRAGVAHVARALLVPAGRLTEVAAVVPAGVEPDDLVTCCTQERDDASPQITTITIDQNLHDLTPFARKDLKQWID